MIVNGNYAYVDFDALKPTLIDVFTEYYGEKYREYITRKINKINYKPFHTVSFIIDYYNKLMTKYKSETDKEFLKLARFRNNDKISNVLDLKSNYLKDTDLFFADSGDLDIDNCAYFTPKGRNDIKQSREKVKEAFNLKGTDEEVFAQIQRLANIYKQAIKNVEQKHDCAVIRDYNRLRANKKEAMIIYLDKAREIGFDVPHSDLKILYNPNFDLDKSYKLSVGRKLFDLDIRYSGLISSFTSESNEALRYGSDYDRIPIMQNRLLYLSKCGLNLGVLTLDELRSDKIDDKLAKKIELEYYYQCQRKDLPETIDYWNRTVSQISKDWKKGQFFPEEMADELEFVRQECDKWLVHNCEFIANVDSEIERDTIYYTIMQYDKQDYFKPTGDIYFTEDNTLSGKAFLSALIHEINHCLSHDLPLKMNDRNVIIKSGLCIKSYKNHKDYKYNPNNINYFNSALMQLEEDYNERQTKDILELALQRIEADDFNFGDEVAEDLREEFDCEYDYYNFLTEDFYQMFKEQIKETKINNMYNLYFRYSLPNLTIPENIFNYLRNRYQKVFKPDEFVSDGVVDFYKVLELARLIEEFKRDIEPRLGKYKNITPKHLFNHKNFRKTDKTLCRMLYEITQKKNKIMDEIRKDTATLPVNHNRTVVERIINGLPGKVYNDSISTEDTEMQK